MNSVAAEERSELERSRGEADRQFERVQEQHDKIKGASRDNVFLSFLISKAVLKTIMQ